ncbi:MAG: S-layer homology domain-containing protein [Oscillospiraceae bacterium]|nr:S-layer homology domain-containing protein [Oscillospiraceae bacterium]
MKKRLPALLLCFCLLISLLSVGATAAAQTMSRHDIVDSTYGYTYYVNDLETDASVNFNDVITPPEGGATVVIYFSAGCSNSSHLISQLARYPWIAHESIKIVALESRGSDQASTQNFADTYAAGAEDYIDFYYNDSRSHMWDSLSQFCSDSTIYFPVVTILTQSGSVRTINYGDCAMASSTMLYNSLAALLPDFAESTTNELPGVVNVTVTGTKIYSEAADVYTLVNQNRSANGVSQVSYNATLTELAMQRAAEIAVFYSHTRPDGNHCSTVADGVYSYTTFGENIAAGQADAADVMDSWMNSEGHRANILNSGYTQIGIGCYVSNDTCYWVQLFGNSTTDTAVTTRTADTLEQVPVRIQESLLSLFPADVTERDIALDDTYTTALINTNQGTGGDYFKSILIPESISVDAALADVTVGEDGLITFTPKAQGQCDLLLKAYASQTSSIGYRFNIVDEVYYDVILNSCPGGTVTANYTRAAEGTLIKIYYYPDEGYELSAHELVVLEGNSISYGHALNYYQFYMPASDVEFTPVFTKLPSAYHDISLSCSTGGTASLNTTTAGAGETVYLTVSPDEGYYLADKSLSGITQLQDLGGGMYSFTMPDNDVSITLTFAKGSSGDSGEPEGNPITLTYNSEGGSASLSASSAKEGETVYLTITPNTCYYVSNRRISSSGSFDGLTDLGNDIYSFTMPSGALSIELTFTANHGSTKISGALDATCTAPGYTGDKVCRNCGEILTPGQEIPASGHSYRAVVTAPTCTEGGFTTYTCGTCSDSYTADETAAAGHTYDAGIVTAPTCTTEGFTTHTCTICGYSYQADYVSALGHEMATDEAVAPSCSAAGLTAGAHCAVCGEILIAQETVPALEHSVIPDDGVPATCTEPGLSSGSHCGVCGAVLIQQTVIPAPGHQYEGKICTRCGAENPYDNPFSDVISGTYYYEPVMWAVKNGITTGLSPTIFGVDENCTRAQFVTFLWRSMGSPEPTATVNPFEDVENGQFYSKAVLWAVEKGITTGLSPTTFGVNDPCTRAQVVTFLWRAAGTPAPAAAGTPFEDVLDNQFYSTAIAWAVEEGITTGLSSSVFGVNIPCNRAQVVTFLYRSAVKD